jgi:hypothetical protein
VILCRAMRYPKLAPAVSPRWEALRPSWRCALTRATAAQSVRTPPVVHPFAEPINRTTGNRAALHPRGMRSQAAEGGASARSITAADAVVPETLGERVGGDSEHLGRLLQVTAQSFDHGEDMGALHRPEREPLLRVAGLRRLLAGRGERLWTVFLPGEG